MCMFGTSQFILIMADKQMTVLALYLITAMVLKLKFWTFNINFYNVEKLKT